MQAVIDCQQCSSERQQGKTVQPLVKETSALQQHFTVESAPLELRSVNCLQIDLQVGFQKTKTLLYSSVCIFFLNGWPYKVYFFILKSSEQVKHIFWLNTLFAILYLTYLFISCLFNSPYKTEMKLLTGCIALAV